MTSLMESTSSRTPEASTPQMSKGNVAIKRSLLTPCRRLGLAKRSPATCTVAKLERESVEKHTSEETLSDLNSENRRSPLCTPTNKRFKGASRRFINRVNDGKLNEKLSGRNIITNHVDVAQKENESKVKEENSLRVTEVVLNSRVNEESGVPVDILLKDSPVPENKINSIIKDDQSLPYEDITREKLEEFRQRIKSKENEVKDLKLAQLYRKKHDLKRLSALTERWCIACQEALQELRDVSESQGCKMTIQQLLEKLGIPSELVRYNTDMEDFV